MTEAEQTEWLADFNPQVPCGTRHLVLFYQALKPPISIHRSLAGPDMSARRTAPHRCYFNPQVPCGTRHRPDRKAYQGYRFQSTGPLRDPTHFKPVVFRHLPISIHRSLAGPDKPDCHADRCSPISIHRSLAGPDKMQTLSYLLL